MEEPPAYHAEPNDEAARVALPIGCFTGVVLGEARGSLDALLDQPEGLLVKSVIENSPAEAAGLREGDLLLSVKRGGDAAADLGLHWPSEWRKLELETPPNTSVSLAVDRGGVDQTVSLAFVPRIRAADRDATPRIREEERVGIVLRGATEVEARAAGLAPGAGAVVVGLARESPWKKRGLRFGDVLKSIDGREIAHQDLVLAAIRSAKPDAELSLAVVRDGKSIEIRAPVSSRASEMRHVGVPIVFDYERVRGESTTSVLLGLFRVRKTSAAWDVRILWLIHFGGGDADRLQEVDA